MNPQHARAFEARIGTSPEVARAARRDREREEATRRNARRSLAALVRDAERAVGTAEHDLGAVVAAEHVGGTEADPDEVARLLAVLRAAQDRRDALLAGVLVVR